MVTRPLSYSSLITRTKQKHVMLTAECPLEVRQLLHIIQHIVLTASLAQNSTLSYVYVVCLQNKTRTKNK